MPFYKKIFNFFCFSVICWMFCFSLNYFLQYYIDNSYIIVDNKKSNKYDVLPIDVEKIKNVDFVILEEFIKNNNYNNIVYTFNEQKNIFTFILKNKTQTFKSVVQNSEYIQKIIDADQENIYPSKYQTNNNNVFFDIIKNIFSLFESVFSFLSSLLFVSLCFTFIGSKISKSNTDIFPSENLKNDKNNDKKITLQDVIGIEKINDEIQLLLSLFKNRDQALKMGIKIPSGVLFTGEPGTGKTMLARAIANEIDCEFFNINASSISTPLVGMSQKIIRDIFEKCRKNKPCVLFIDEIDSIAGQRGNASGSNVSLVKEQNSIVNQLLTEMSGFDDSQNKDILVLAATNFPEHLDEALLRSGRFDKKIHVPTPDFEGREKLIMKYSEDKNIDPQIDFKKIASLTAGFTGADIENLMNESAITAFAKNSSVIEEHDIEVAYERIVAGINGGAVKNKDLLKIIAYHEAGHALVSMTQENNYKQLHKISIEQRNQALGVTMYLPKEENSLMSKKDILNQIETLLGGRIAEEIVFGKDLATVGASDDLNRANLLARKMISSFGFDNDFGLFVIPDTNEAAFATSEKIKEQCDKKVKDILLNTAEKVKTILEENSKALDNIANILLQKNEISAQEALKIFEESKK